MLCSEWNNQPTKGHIHTWSIARTIYARLYFCGGLLCSHYNKVICTLCKKKLEGILEHLGNYLLNFKTVQNIIPNQQTEEQPYMLVKLQQWIPLPELSECFMGKW